ncbi:hypothetical protein [Cytobacillus gottheilii]|uniref:hypothetical protein n=1 Tax=Cytobacillus gottheilii TaxID=859144 RepID=UPI0008303E90|nr:hypothetical protein [Cytobacillus gottheilii]
MEKKLSNLRAAMNSSTHKGKHFTEIQKRKIMSSLNQIQTKEIRKPNVSIYLISTIAATLFFFVVYTGLFTNLSLSGDINQNDKQTVENQWEIREEYSKNNKVLFNVSPDPYLTAGKSYGYIFSFKESFNTYRGKEIEIYAIHKETGDRINVLTPFKISEPTPGYSSLGRFTASLTVPESGIWKYEVYFDKKLYGDVVLLVGSENNQTKIILPKNTPSFILTRDFENVEWSKEAVDLGNNIIGNDNKSGVIGADMPSLNINQKWMWHLWGIDNTTENNLTVVGLHKESDTVHQILTTGWSIELGGENNGADAHAPSSVNIPLKGEWAVLLYVNDELFDILVYNITD